MRTHTAQPTQFIKGANGLSRKIFQKDGGMRFIFAAFAAGPQLGAILAGVSKNAGRGAVALVAATCLLGFAANAETDSPAWIGGLGGFSVPSADHTTSRGIYGVTAGAKLGSEYGLGVYYMSSRNNESTIGNFNYDLYGFEFGYHFEGEAHGAYFGARAGTSKLTVGSNSASPFHWGIFAGYNYMIGDHFSLGGEGGFMSVSKASDIPEDGFTVLNFLLTAKFWL